MRAPYTAVLRTFAGSRSAGMKTQAAKPCCADCAATAFARLPVDEQPTVLKPKRPAAASAVATTRSLKDREGKQTASFLKYRFRRPQRLARCRERTSGVPPALLGAANPSGSGRNSKYRHMWNSRPASLSFDAIDRRVS